MEPARRQPFDWLAANRSRRSALSDEERAARAGWYPDDPG
jgi:hypothetical protein